MTDMPNVRFDLELEEHMGALPDDKGTDLPLPGGGRIFMDRPLPFLCLFREPAETGDDVSHRLVTTQASFAVRSDPSSEGALADALDRVSDAMAERFGAFLLLEIWCRSTERDAVEPYELQPEFRVFASEAAGIPHTVEALKGALGEISIQHFPARVSVPATDRPASSAPQPRRDLSQDGRISFIGVEVEPIYRRPDGNGVFPFLFERLRSQLADALCIAQYEFSREATHLAAPGYRAMGRRSLERTVKEVDEGLSSIAGSFEFLLLATPINTDEAWASFKDDGCSSDPVFRYRPLPIDPSLLKRRLFALPIERVDDPGLRLIFREKQEELDRQITMLSDRDSRRFFFESLQLYGEVGGRVLEEALDLLGRLPVEDYDLESIEHLDAEAFSEMAVSEMRYYRRNYPAFPATVQIRNDLPPGLLVSQGRLLIGHRTRVPAERVEALIHHEVGTHMVTYYNGRAQPLRLFSEGFAGYEALQEGLAVLSEYLVDGLHVPRLRTLAARVVAAHALIEGCSFVDLFRLLHFEHGFPDLEAFSITLRTFRGGGLVKDVVYLRGLLELMRFIREGGDVEALFVGKVGLHHLPLLDDLRARRILRPAPLRPRMLDHEPAASRLEAVRSGRTFLDLIGDRPT